MTIAVDLGRKATKETNLTVCVCIYYSDDDSDNESKSNSENEDKDKVPLRDQELFTRLYT